MKLEKKLMNNLVKKTSRRNNLKSNFNETFKNFYNINNIATKK